MSKEELEEIETGLVQVDKNNTIGRETLMNREMALLKSDFME